MYKDDILDRFGLVMNQFRIQNAVFGPSLQFFLDFLWGIVTDGPFVPVKELDPVIRVDLEVVPVPLLLGHVFAGGLQTVDISWFWAEGIFRIRRNQNGSVGIIINHFFNSVQRRRQA
jgi:hypothetical protein